MFPDKLDLVWSKVYVCSGITCHLHFWQNDLGLLDASMVTWGWNGHRINVTLLSAAVVNLVRSNARDVYGRKCYLKFDIPSNPFRTTFLVSKNGWLKQAFLGSVLWCLYYFSCQCSGQVVRSCHIFVVTKAALARYCFLFVVTWYCIHCFGFVLEDLGCLLFFSFIPVFI